MENILGALEYYFALEFLVDLGNFYAAKCASVGGEWVQMADNSYACEKDLIGEWASGLLNN